MKVRKIVTMRTIIKSIVFVVICILVSVVAIIGCSSSGSSGLFEEYSEESNTQEKKDSDNPSPSTSDDAIFEDQEEESLEKAVYASATGNVKIRKEPNTNCGVLGYLKPDDTVKILGEDYDDGWCNIEFDGIEGYVKLLFLKVLILVRIVSHS